MRNIRLVTAGLFALLLLAASLAVAKPAASTTHPLLVGTDGPGFTITLKKSGKLVKVLKHGTYTIKIYDKSSIHNFHLRGPGVNKKTSVGRVYKSTWTVTLKKGKYTYVCDPHAEFMRGAFIVK